MEEMKARLAQAVRAFRPTDAVLWVARELMLAILGVESRINSCTMVGDDEFSIIMVRMDDVWYPAGASQHVLERAMSYVYVTSCHEAGLEPNVLRQEVMDGMRNIGSEVPFATSFATFDESDESDAADLDALLTRLLLN